MPIKTKVKTKVGAKASIHINSSKYNSLISGNRNFNTATASKYSGHLTRTTIKTKIVSKLPSPMAYFCFIMNR